MCFQDGVGFNTKYTSSCCNLHWKNWQCTYKTSHSCQSGDLPHRLLTGDCFGQHHCVLICMMLDFVLFTFGRSFTGILGLQLLMCVIQMNPSASLWHVFRYYYYYYSQAREAQSLYHDEVKTFMERNLAKPGQSTRLSVTVVSQLYLWDSSPMK